MTESINDRYILYSQRKRNANHVRPPNIRVNHPTFAYGTDHHKFLISSKSAFFSTASEKPNQPPLTQMPADSFPSLAQPGTPDFKLR